MSKRRLLVVGAHSADFVWRAAGAVAAHTAAGGEALVVALSYGERGESGELWKVEGQTEEKVKRIRHEEATKAAAAVGAEFQGFDLGDYPLEVGKEGVDRLVEVLRELAPHVVLRTLTAGRQFADLGTESGDYQKLLGVGASPEAGVLLLRGLLVDGELTGVLSLSEPKTRFGHRLSEKVAPAVDLFALAFARLAERRAREEAVRALEDLTRSLNEEHARAVAALQSKLSEAQAALNGKGMGDTIRVTQLKRAIEVAAVEARSTAQRLSAVEEQVRVAVTKLEKAHVQLHAQGEALQNQSNIIYRVEQTLRDAMAGQDSRKVIEEVLQIVASREQASSL